MKANLLIDWFSFTVKCKGFQSINTGELHSSDMRDVQYVIENILKIPFDCFHSLGYGRYGYRDCMSYEGINVYYDGFGIDMGLSVSLSGNACRVYERYHSMMELVKREHEEEEAHVTRIDLACDDKTGVFDVPFIIDEIRGRRLRSLIRKKRGIVDLDGNSDEGDTVYIGSEKSEIRFRIYDKAKEQGDYKGVWNRIEGVFRRTRAEAVVDLLVGSGRDFGDCVSEIFNAQIQFINLDDSNITRCSVAQWWLDFIETVKCLKLALPELPKSSVDRLHKHFEVLSSCIYVLTEALGKQEWDSFYERGKDKAKPRHRQMISDYISLTMA